MKPLVRHVPVLLDPVPAEADAASNRRTFTISTRAVDREGDVMDPAGCDVRDYLRNPIVLWAHDYSGGATSGRVNIIGKCPSLTIRSDDIVADVDFAPTPFAQEVKSLVDGKFINGASVGFLPADGGDEPIVNAQGQRTGTKYAQWKLLEWSLVPVPANPEALAHTLSEARAKGLTVDSLEQAMRAVPTTKPNTEAKTMSWSVGGAKGLPVDSERSWDAAAAVSRVALWAGDDKAKYARAFVVSHPDGRALPFADVIDGKLVAVRRALVAARASLSDGLDVGDAKEAASAFVDAYLGAPEDGKGVLRELEIAWAERDEYKKALLDVALTGKSEVLAKVGAVLSQANRSRLQQAFDHTQKAMDACDGLGKSLKTVYTHHEAMGDLHQKILDRFTDAAEMVRSVVGIRSAGGDATSEVNIQAQRDAIVKALVSIVKDLPQYGDTQPVPAPPLSTGGPGTGDQYTGGGSDPEALRAAHRALVRIGKMIKDLGDPMSQAARAREKAALLHENVSESIPQASQLLKDVLGAPFQPDRDDTAETGNTGKTIIVEKGGSAPPASLTSSAPLAALLADPETLLASVSKLLDDKLRPLTGKVS